MHWSVEVCTSISGSWEAEGGPGSVLNHEADHLIYKII